MDKAKELGEGKILQLMIRFSIPAVIGMVITSIYNIVDRIFIGREVGALALAGVSIGFPVMMSLMAFSMLIGMGATALISIRLGEQRKAEAELILGNTFILLIALSMLFFGVGLFFLDPLLKLFGASSTILPFAREYVGIILSCSIFQIIGFGMNNIIRAEGNPRLAMLTMLIAALLNIILDYIFIFPLGMGIRGAALATVLAQAISALMILYYFFRGKSLLKIKVPNLHLQKPLIASIAIMGLPSFITGISHSLIAIALNNSLLFYGGDIAISAMGIIGSVMMLCLMPVLGISMGVQPIIGYNYGAKNFDRVMQTLKLAILVTTSVCLCGFLAVQFLTPQIVGLFGKEPQLIGMASQGIKIFLMMLPIIGFQIICSNYFQAVGKPKQALLLILSRQILFLLPLLLILPRFFQLLGIWMAGPAADLAATMITGIWFLKEIKNLGQKHDESILLRAD